MECPLLSLNFIRNCFYLRFFNGFDWFLREILKTFLETFNLKVFEILIPLLTTASYSLLFLFEYLDRV